MVPNAETWRVGHLHVLPFIITTRRTRATRNTLSVDYEFAWLITIDEER